uniref:Uncharacterized protein n=1 Tax=Marinobacter nauticus TaxID=2743 RepID=A0A455WG03_MARNT|nr:hypothetical protein YBY_30020 [Marinobacter nauticus]
MPRYNINSPVKHDGRIIKSGVLSLESEEAEPLLRSGALSPAEDAQEPISPPATSNDGEGSDGNGAAAGEPVQPAAATSNDGEGSDGNGAAAGEPVQPAAATDKPSATKPATKPTSKATKAKG